MDGANWILFVWLPPITAITISEQLPQHKKCENSIFNQKGSSNVSGQTIYLSANQCRLSNNRWWNEENVKNGKWETDCQSNKDKNEKSHWHSAIS